MIKSNKKTVILGLGNIILTDDGVGIYVVCKIKKLLYPSLSPLPIGERVKGEGAVAIKEASLGGFNFIDLLTGYNRAIIVDAIHTKNGKPGEFYELDISALKPSARLSSSHGIDFATAVNMAREMKIAFPEDIRIFVMEVEDEFTFGTSCTKAVEAAIPKMADFIVEELKRCITKDGHPKRSEGSHACMNFQ